MPAGVTSTYYRAQGFMCDGPDFSGRVSPSNFYRSRYRLCARLLLRAFNEESPRDNLSRQCNRRVQFKSMASGAQAFGD